MMLLTAVLLLAACTDADEATDALVSDAQVVDFGAYVNRGTTRGGSSGELSTVKMRDGDKGFGVFAFYTHEAPYNQMALPNFMYNQQVTYNSPSTEWTYSPVKYWPNGEGDTKGLTGQSPHYITFFAYAPYVAPNTLGQVEGTGITGLTRVNEHGDPIVRYCASMEPSKAVDLCWATPHFNETKPDVATRVNFNFHHALSSLNVQMDADIDVVSHAASSLDGHTRIYVRSVTFTGFTDKGQLNLNNTGTLPVWSKLDCDCDLTAAPYTLYDGRRDDYEGVSSTFNERPTGLNPAIVQSGLYTVRNPWDSGTYSTTPGVTNNAVNLFDVSEMTSAAGEKAAAPIYVNPTNDPMTVNIVYDVETYDPKLVSQYLGDGQTHGSTIENNITATISTIQMQAGKRYNVKLHLGMASVKVDASVTAWDYGGSATVNVPEN